MLSQNIKFFYLLLFSGIVIIFSFSYNIYTHISESGTCNTSTNFIDGFNDPFGGPGPDEPFLDPLPFIDPSFQQIEELVLLETLETFPVPGFELDDPVSIDVEEIIETQIAAIEERREEREEREAEEEFAEVLEELFQDEAEGERLAEEVFEEEAVEETIEALEEIFEEELIAREEELEE